MKRKSAFIIIISVVLAVLFAVQPTAKAASETAENNKEYISEVKIGVGKTEAEAASSLDGYTILKDNGKNVDLNQDAGGGIGSKGERVVYLGYKTTTDRSEAITDLAVMNMKGGYSVKDYELLMEQYMAEQIIPLVEGLVSAIEEYRANYKSYSEENRARAKYVHDALNNLRDDDCGGVGLGDLLLNETKYEMGDEAYMALSKSNRKKHADIVTIIAQANGKATLLMENLLIRAADDNFDTWIDRFVSTSYEDLLGLYPDMLPSDASAELAKEYDDDAREILSMWSAFKAQLDDYDKNEKAFETISKKDLSENQEQIEKFDPENADKEQISEYAENIAELIVYTEASANLSTDIDLKNYLSSVEYGDGTLYDFFKQDYEEIAKDITVLYPLAASLSAGQRGGLGFTTLSELVSLAVTDGEGYKDAKIDELTKASIYEGVDRDIYKKGGVALTSAALRAHSAEELAAENGSGLSTLTCVLIGVTAASAVALGIAVTAKLASKIGQQPSPADVSRLNDIKENLDATRSSIKIVEDNNNVIEEMKKSTASEKSKFTDIDEIDKEFSDVSSSVDDEIASAAGKTSSDTLSRLQARSSLCNKLMIGFGVAMVVLSAVSLYFTYRDLVDYYDVEYSSIPKYMVDEKDITAYNAKGEKIVIKNQAAYYKAVETNRAEGDEWYDILGTSADLNGTVGRQWLTLYAAKNENESPILASSLKAVVDSDKVPADYTTGIHMFGSEAAYNLNNTQLVWNSDAKSVYVYFRADENASGASTNASTFTAGYLILTGIGGLAVGAAAAVCITVFLKKKRKEAK